MTDPGLASKHVEMQMEEAGALAVIAEAPAVPPSVQSLRLDKSRILAQLENARHPLYRRILLRGLKSVEQDLKALGY